MKKILLGTGTILAVAAPVAIVVSCSGVSEPSITSGAYNLRDNNATASLNETKTKEWNLLLKDLTKEKEIDKNNEIIITYSLGSDKTVDGVTYTANTKFEIHKVDYSHSSDEVKFGYLTLENNTNPIIEFWKVPRRDC